MQLCVGIRFNSLLNSTKWIFFFLARKKNSNVIKLPEMNRLPPSVKTSQPSRCWFLVFGLQQGSQLAGNKTKPPPPDTAVRNITRAIHIASGGVAAGGQSFVPGAVIAFSSLTEVGASHKLSPRYASQTAHLSGFPPDAERPEQSFVLRCLNNQTATVTSVLGQSERKNVTFTARSCLSSVLRR